MRTGETIVSGRNRAERRRALWLRTSDPLARKFGRVMSDPAMRERCSALKYGESTTADIAEGLQLMVTRLQGDELGWRFLNVIFL